MSSVGDILLAGRVGDSRWQRLRRGLRKHGLAYILLAPIVILLVAFMAAPFASLLYYGVHETSLDGTVNFVGLGNFIRLINESRFIQNISATLIYLVGVLVISLPVAYFGAILITSNIRGGGVFRTLLLIPWILAPVVTALLFRTMLNPTSGPITILLKWIFGHGVYLTLSPAGSRLVIILHSAWRSFPLEMILLAAGMASIPPDLYDAARVDGANLWQQFIRITVPLTRVSLLSAVIIITVYTIQDAEGVYALTQGGPGYATEVTGVRLFKEAFLYFNIGQASSIGIALIVLSILVMIIYLRVLGQGEAD